MIQTFKEISIYLSEKQKDNRETEGNLSSTSSLTKCPQWQGLDQETGTQSMAPHMGGNGSSP